MRYPGATWACLVLLSIPMLLRAEEVIKPSVPHGSILKVLQTDGRYKILLAALKDTALEKTLAGNEALTLFAPLDEAFERVPKLAALLANREKLDQVLARHAVNGVLDTTELRKVTSLQPQAGEALKVRPGDKFIEINDAKILVPDVRVPKGIVHGIDHVLMTDNDSMMREAGAAIERGLKNGAEKVEEVFDGKSSEEKTK